MESESLNKARLEFEEKKKKENELFQERLDAQLKVDRKLIEEKVKAKAIDENAEVMKNLQEELRAKSEQVKELNLSRAEVEKLKREKSELKEAIEAEAQKRLTDKLNLEKEKIRKSEEEKNELRFKNCKSNLRIKRSSPKR